MTILIINGPSLNLLGEREPEIYGSKTYTDLTTSLEQLADKLGVKVIIHQTNYEGMIIDLLQLAHREKYHGVLLNAGAFTHYSYALYDAIKAISIPVIEVHLTAPMERQESFRKTSVIQAVCKATFSGQGFDSYRQALTYLSGVSS